MQLKNTLELLKNTHEILESYEVIKQEMHKVNMLVDHNLQLVKTLLSCAGYTKGQINLLNL